MARDRKSESRVTPELHGQGIRVAIVCGRFNDHITQRLLEGSADRLQEMGVDESDITVFWVPGSFEIPVTAQILLQADRCDVVIALGCVIRGETSHYDLVAGECARGLQEVQLATGKPAVFGVVTTENLDQALARSGTADNKGRDSADTAIEMCLLLRRLSEGSPS